MAPATGREVQVDELAVRFPEDYDDISRQGTFGWMGFGEMGDSLSVAEIEAGPQSDEELERSGRRLGLWRDNTPERGEDVEIAGVSMIHLYGRGGPGQHADLYAAHVGDHVVQLRFSQSGRPAERERVVASVLASIEWRG
ncbi:hypothetical protein ACFP3Q_06420 [Nocardioides sp. GCM10027113]|uniref:hypothetical protein n=1 Tax=unclassified Nocardioides TaxID=2615069 RepID=UPI00360EEB21